jgi:hypothetical protein
MLLDRQSAITLEDDDPLAHFGEEAPQPSDTGQEPADEDHDPPKGLTSEQLAEEEASASAGDLEFSEEGAEQ